MHPVIHDVDLDRWEAIARRNVWQVDAMPPSAVATLMERVRGFLETRLFEGCDGLELTEGILVTIAAQAGLITLGRSDIGWEFVTSVLVYPAGFARVNRNPESVDFLRGEAWPKSAVILSWDDVLLSGIAPYPVLLVVHELAHALDMQHGGPNGCPLQSGSEIERWNEVMTAEFEAHGLALARGEPTVLGSYAGTDCAEFFAEAAACFLQAPWSLGEERPELYALLAGYLNQDPAEEWSAGIDPERDERYEAAVQAQEAKRLEAYSRAIEAYPEDAAAYWRRGGLLYARGRLDDSLRDYDAGVALDPDEPELRRDRARLLLELERPADAIRDLDAVLEGIPEWAFVYAERADAKLHAGDVDGAGRDAARALELDDEIDLAWSFRGEVALLRGDAAEALSCFDRALEGAPEDGGFRALRCAALVRLGRLDEAEADLVQCEEEGFVPHVCEELRSELSLSRGDAEEALRAADRAVELEPDRADPYAVRADAKRGLGDLEGALADIEKALALKPWVLDGERILARIRAELADA